MCRCYHESHTTHRVDFHVIVSELGEGNGNPLQYSCLENPMDRGDWPTMVLGTTESDMT